MKIISVLLNPTIDQIYKIEDFEVGGTFLVKESLIYPVGKTISFSLGVRELSKEVEIKVIAFIGREKTSLYSNFLKKRNIDFEFIIIEGKTRSNKTINDPIKHTTTHIRERGFDINAKKFHELMDLLENNILKEDFVVFSGSIPPNAEIGIYFELINMCKEKRAITVLDSNGEALKKGVKANPRIIKPNLIELSQILNDPKIKALINLDIKENYKEIIERARVLLNNGIEIILITLGEKGAILLSPDSSLYGNVHVDKVIDTVGSGDSFLAGFILKFSQKEEITKCFKYALASGAANTLIQGPGIFNIEDVKKLIEKVEINELN